MSLSSKLTQNLHVRSSAAEAWAAAVAAVSLRLTVDTLGPYAKSKIVQPEQEAQSRDQPVIDKGMDYYFGC